MKTYRLKHLFEEILHSIIEIENFYSLIREKNDPDIEKMGKRAIEREILSIATQWNRINEVDQELVLKKIVNVVKLSRRLKSAYIQVASKLLFSLVEQELPELKDEIEMLLNEQD